MAQHHYLEKTSGQSVCIVSSKRPSKATIPRQGTWIIREWDINGQMFRVAGEVTWGTINQKLHYLGSSAFLQQQRNESLEKIEQPNDEVTK